MATWAMMANANPAYFMLNSIRKAYKTSKMTYKLVNKGIQLYRKANRMLMMRRLKQRLTKRCKARAAKAAKELKILTKASKKLSESIEQDRRSVSACPRVSVCPRGYMSPRA
jgi:hypothetical protein